MEINEDRLYFKKIHHPGGAGLLFEVRLDGENGILIAKVNEGMVTGKLQVLDREDREVFAVRNDREAVVNWLVANAANLMKGEKNE